MRCDKRAEARYDGKQKQPETDDDRLALAQTPVHGPPFPGPEALASGESGGYEEWGVAAGLKHPI